MSYAPILSKPAFNQQSHNPNSTISFSPDYSETAARPRKEEPARPAKSKPKQGNDWPIIVHCHLCWDWVWQRPQQFISRLSSRHKVLFVETAAPDPQLAAPLARFHVPQNFPNLTILRIQFPAWRWADGAYVDAERRRLVQEFVNGPGAGQLDNPIQWFYDPM